MRRGPLHRKAQQPAPHWGYSWGYSYLLVLEPDGLEISLICDLLGASGDFLPIRWHTREGKELQPIRVSTYTSPASFLRSRNSRFAAFKIMRHHLARMDLQSYVGGNQASVHQRLSMRPIGIPHACVLQKCTCVLKSSAGSSRSISTSYLFLSHLTFTATDGIAHALSPCYGGELGT